MTCARPRIWSDWSSAPLDAEWAFEGFAYCDIGFIELSKIRAMSQIVDEKMGATVTIKDVLLGLSVRTALDRGRDYTLAMASHFDAKVTGVFYSLEPTVSLSMYPDFTSQLMQNHRSEEKKMRKSFAKTLLRRQLS